jgi:hypothetical protein
LPALASARYVATSKTPSWTTLLAVNRFTIGSNVATAIGDWNGV